MTNSTACTQCGSGLAPAVVVCARCGTPVPGGGAPREEVDPHAAGTVVRGGAVGSGQATVIEPVAPPAAADLATGATQVLTADDDGRVTTPSPLGQGASESGPLGVGEPFGDRYQILKVLGVGGMGAVYQAWDHELGVAVALKVIRTEVADPSVAEEMSARFKRELLLAREVTHRNVVRIHDLGDMNGMKFFTMTYVDGEDLASLIHREKKLPPRRALEIFRQLASGLGAAHEKGIVHRDLKPANIMLDEQGNALLMDFGIARSSGSSVRPQRLMTGEEMAEIEAQEPDLGQTMAGTIVGTLEFMSPEQFRGEVADQRADVYALGLILYDMLLGGRRVQSAKTAIDEVQGRMGGLPTPPHQIDPTIPVALDQVVEKCLHPDPSERFQSTRELQEALDALDEDGNPLPRFTRRFVAASTVAAVALVAALVGTYFLGRGDQITAEPDPMSVLVADLDNQTGEAVFADALEQAVAVGLEAAPFVNIFPRGRAQSRARTIREDTDGLDSELAQLVAQSEGVGVVITGGIERRGQGYSIALQAVDSVTSEVLGEDARRARGIDDVLPAVGEIVVRLRRRLGDTVPDAVAAAEEETFTSASMEAAQSYARAQDLMAAGSWRDAVPLYREAVERDPEFGRAYAGLGASHFNLGQRDEAEGYYQQALAHIDRMTQRERFRTRGAYYLRVGNWEKAVEELAALVDGYPADEAGLSNLALANFFARDFEAALVRGRQAVDTYPNNVLSRGNLALYAMYAADFETSEEVAREVIAANPAYETAYVALAMAAADRGDLAAADGHYRALREVSSRGAAIANLGRTDLAFLRGDHAAAAELLEQGLAADLASGENSFVAIKQVALADAKEALGRANEARSLLDLAVESTRNSRVRFEAAWIHALAGRDRDALAIAGEIALRGNADDRALARIIEGETALERGNPEAALESFRAARDLADSWLARYGLGRAYLATGAFAEAHSELDRCLSRRGEAAAIFFDDLPTYHYLAPLHYYLGRALEGLGSEGAADEYRRYLELRGSASADPLADDARVRLAQAAA